MCFINETTKEVGLFGWQVERQALLNSPGTIRARACMSACVSRAGYEARAQKEALKL